MLNDIDKKYVYIVFGVAIVLFIIVLIIIWAPMFDKNQEISLSSYKDYSMDEYLEAAESEYAKELLNLINIENVDNTVKLLNEDYLNENNITIDNAKQYLIDNDLVGYTSSSTIVSFEKVKTDYKTYIYTYIYKIGNNEKKVHIIEDYYDKYTISFEQDGYPKLYDNSFTANYNDIEFTIKELKSYNEELIVEFTASNKGNDQITINLENPTDSKIKFTNEEEYFASALVVGSKYSSISITPGSTNTFDISYNVPFEEQAQFKQIIFNSVKDYAGNNIVIELAAK